MSAPDVAAAAAALAVCPGLWIAAVLIDHRDAMRRRQARARGQA